MGYFLWLNHQKSVVKHEVKSLIKEKASDDELTLLEFTAEELLREVKFEHAKEFEYKGQMYDIVKVSYKDNKIQYYCWKDHKENDLNKKMESLIASFWGEDPIKQNQKTQLMRFARNLIQHNHTNYKFLSKQSEIANIHYLLIGYSDPDLALIDPPPRFS
ncbi:hypothetical protein K6119_01145 [Paracrocinitomix mangrovi]|uniref:hypothetical protein n=1 Tax=Paracrocinitomix mangrovi TaxID=2862509 RepID=UPI001C8D6C7E|nr:hypothetical protein [Paracrocinitomix mangrovi]UKN02121.1 hypothetical protein K6119_01145 [Paracrocinitomix mangrovi]